MENTASSAKAQPKAPATPGQALTFRAAPQSEPRRDTNRRCEGKQIVHDGFGPVFRTPTLLDDSSLAWYQEGDLLPPGVEAKNNGHEEDPVQDDGENHLPTPVPGHPDPVPWSRLDYRTQALIMKSLTKFYEKELFALDAACEALHLYRHEADAFIARHFEEYSKVIAGEIDGTTFLDRGTVHMAGKYMMEHRLPPGAVTIVIRRSLQTAFFSSR
ncbi:hypothetical protein PG996_009697 [Apiospora saccharicola]|uniref:Uncharacterized protein n=1 Tax=Apiospora saccharicola TaxID=335842 RepID=A0ABR1UM64_9PEZI